MTQQAERRRTRRCQVAAEHGIVAARVRPGYDAALIDVSPGGALIETAHRLAPGATVELQLATHTARAAVRGRVLRCAVAALHASAVCYRGAISFDCSLDLIPGEERGGGAQATRGGLE